LVELVQKFLNIWLQELHLYQITYIIVAVFIAGYLPGYCWLFIRLLP